MSEMEAHSWNGCRVPTKLEDVRVAEDLRERDRDVGTRVLESEEPEVIRGRTAESSRNFKFRVRRV